MGTLTDEWEAGSAEHGARPLALAFMLSVVCHGALLAMVGNVGLKGRPVPPLVVTMLGSGAASGAGRGAAAIDAASSAPPAVVPEPVARPVAAAKQPARPIVAPPPVQRARSIAKKAVASTAPITAPAVPAPPPAGATSEGRASADGTTAAVASGGDLGAGTESGSGSGRGTPGTGGVGTGGSDGLRAFCASCPAPEYPGRARRQGWQGTVDVELTIASDGGVREARVGRSSGYPALDDVALDVARRSRFTVPSAGQELRGQLRYRFVLDATAARR